MKKILSYVSASFLLVLFLSGCKNDYRPALDWSPTFADAYYQEPLGCYQFRQLCEYMMYDNNQPGFEDEDSSEEDSSEDSVPAIAQPNLIGNHRVEVVGVCINDQKPAFSQDNFLLMSAGSLTIDPKTVKQCVAAKRNIIFAAEGFKLKSGYEMPMNGYLYNLDTLVKHSKTKYRLTTIHEPVRTKDDYTFPTVFCSRAFPKNNLQNELANHFLPGMHYKYFRYLATSDNGVLACMFQFDNGATVGFVTSPYLFTNYGVEYDYGHINSLSMALLHEMGLKHKADKNRLAPFRRYYYTNIWENGWLKGNREIYPSEIHYERSGRDLMDNFSDVLPYLIVVGTILLPFVLFRRRQRVIPVAQGYVNRSADYLQRVGLLFFNHAEFDALIAKKRNYFYNEIKERLHIELGNNEALEANALLLSKSINSNEDLRPFLERLNSKKSWRMGKIEFNDICLKMNEILYYLKGGKSPNDMQ